MVEAAQQETQKLGSDDLSEVDYAAAGRSCDIVMKGGITSGVVYPHGVCELARTYRFRNVGGTSAGAIAAAATAAAEYGRAKQGFNELAKLPGWLGEGSNLSDLFQPQPSTRKLYAVLFAAVDGGKWKAAGSALLNHPTAAAMGALPGAVLLVLSLVAAIISGSKVMIEVAAVLAPLAAVPLMVLGIATLVGWRIFVEAKREVPGNRFGLCSGMKGEGPGADALTEWLDGRLETYAGRTEVRKKTKEPLTFGDLWDGPAGWQPDTPGEHFVELSMMTTNLVNRRAHQIPWEDRSWFFKPSELRQLFPEQVVDFMEKHSPSRSPEYKGTPAERRSRVRLALARERGLLALPPAEKMPVLVCTRMSLSFPILLSAVPLWNLDMSAPVNEVLNDWKTWAAAQGSSFDPLASERKDWPAEGKPKTVPEPECCWFSDGGISSNFPVHFFDRLVPRWPTFAINLRPFAPWQTPSTNQMENTSMVTSNSDGIAEWWYRFSDGDGKDKRLAAFLESIVRTMQNRLDEAQMRVPGFRDRIAHVSMSDKEGGMNLTMEEDTITALTERGQAAARKLRDAYTSDSDRENAITWDNHRWLRLRSSLAVLEEMHRRFDDGYAKPPLQQDEGEATYVELIERGEDDPPNSYRWASEDQKALALAEIAAIQGAAAAAANGRSVVPKAPKPGPVGRIVPRN